MISQIVYYVGEADRSLPVFPIGKVALAGAAICDAGGGSGSGS